MTFSAQADFIVLTWNEHGKVDAAAHFRAEPQNGFKVGKERALHSGARKFSVYAIKISADALHFNEVRK